MDRRATVVRWVGRHGGQVLFRGDSISGGGTAPAPSESDFPYLGFTDLYRHAAYHGGAFHSGFYAPYYTFVGATQKVPLSPRVRHLLSYVFNRLWIQRQTTRFFARTEEQLPQQMRPEASWMRQYAQLLFDEPFDGPFYREKIRVASPVRHRGARLLRSQLGQRRSAYGRRLRDGKVYTGDAAQRAGQHFFRKGNLIALRELALRRTAEQVDAQMQRYRHDHAIGAVWPTSERILVRIGPGPLGPRLVRATRRHAMGLRATWIVAYVETSASLRLTEAEREEVFQTLRLAEQLGAETITLSGQRVSDEIVSYARTRNVVRIVVGKQFRRYHALAFRTR